MSTGHIRKINSGNRGIQLSAFYTSLKYRVTIVAPAGKKKLTLEDWMDGVQRNIEIWHMTKPENRLDYVLLRDTAVLARIKSDIILRDYCE